MTPKSNSKTFLCCAPRVLGGAKAGKMDFGNFALFGPPKINSKTFWVMRCFNPRPP